MGKILTGLMIAAVCGCATTSTWSAAVLRPAENVPSRFETEDETMRDDGCRSPLLDPRDNALLRMVRSSVRGSVHLADYEVPAGRYGVREGELLRIDCGTGEALGVVAG